MRHHKLNKDRALRHLARDTLDRKIVRISRDDLLDLSWESLEEQSDRLIRGYLATWIRLMRIKHGDDVLLDLYYDYDIDFNTYRFGGRVVPEEYRRPLRTHETGTPNA